MQIVVVFIHHSVHILNSESRGDPFLMRTGVALFILAEKGEDRHVQARAPLPVILTGS